MSITHARPICQGHQLFKKRALRIPCESYHGNIKLTSEMVLMLADTVIWSISSLFLHRCSRGGRTAKLIFSGNGLIIVLALGIWRMSFG